MLYLLCCYCLIQMESAFRVWNTQAVSGMPSFWKAGILWQHVQMEWFVFGQYVMAWLQIRWRLMPMIPKFLSTNWAGNLIINGCLNSYRLNSVSIEYYSCGNVMIFYIIWPAYPVWFHVFCTQNITAKYMRAFLYLRKKVGGLKLDELPGLDSLTSPGTTYYPIINFYLTVERLNFKEISREHIDNCRTVIDKCLIIIAQL